MSCGFIKTAQLSQRGAPSSWPCRFLHDPPTCAWQWHLPWLQLHTLKTEARKRLFGAHRPFLDLLSWNACWSLLPGVKLGQVLPCVDWLCFTCSRYKFFIRSVFASILFQSSDLPTLSPASVGSIVYSGEVWWISFVICQGSRLLCLAKKTARLKVKKYFALSFMF